MRNTTNPTLEVIDEELNRLRKIRNLLAGLPMDATSAECANKRRLSPEARQRIVDAQKRRWATAKARN